MPLLLFVDDISAFLVVSYIILSVLSCESIVSAFKPSKENESSDDIKKLKAELQESVSLDIRRLELGFKTAKVIFTATFVISVLFILDNTLFISALSVLVLFMSAVELMNSGKSYRKQVAAASGIVNVIYLAAVLLLKYLV
jgi:hypothetical protein